MKFSAQGVENRGRLCYICFTSIRAQSGFRVCAPRLSTQECKFCPSAARGSVMDLCVGSSLAALLSRSSSCSDTGNIRAHRCRPGEKMSRKANQSLEFSANQYVVYPAHGVGRIMRIEEQEIAGTRLELFVISFEKDKMTLRVPTAKASSVGMRSLASPDLVAQALKTLTGKARVKRAMWSRRAQEYEQKINSGDIISIAEVIRDLHRGEDQPDQSYSERQLYEAALERLTREVAVVEKLDEKKAAAKVGKVLEKKAA